MNAPASVDLASLRRRLWLYRALSLFLTVFVLCVLLALRSAMAVPEDPDVEVFDVPARFEALSQKNPDAADVSETYFYADGATVHMHVMGRGQTCPLHIHRKTHEATIIVAGQAEVHQVWGQEDGLAERRGTHGPGELIASGPFTGHAWFNRATDRMLGNLVFASPRFDGNLYVEADDARMRQGAAPFVHVPPPAAEVLAGSAVREVPLPALSDRMTVVHLGEGDYAVAGTRAAPVLVYVTQGEGDVSAGDARPMKPGQLWVLRRKASVRARQGHPLSFYVFKPGA
ncbi:hypothetical protein [Comamonas sp. JC664]|uniref:hypothetical protein n=1 Tax=Comamonas sp. JC664 TaxID=2801917 RepID=UPI00174DD6E8|nr:hypothetical protein [Comamonas sp. JC664]MBL0696912.1 hypothetical protein [Comamonas sp. JC664]GHG81472.1 hypothetical protein GCM10012319_34700 [Comamonas sp. KCTC 72670]